jgi:hypothetical protein
LIFTQSLPSLSTTFTGFAYVSKNGKTQVTTPGPKAAGVLAATQKGRSAMKAHRNLGVLFAAFFVLAVAACAQTGDTMKEKSMADDTAMMEKKADGMFMGSDGHMAAGKAEITEGMGGKTVLKLTDIHVDKVPDGYVYLTRGGDRMNGVSLGKLEQFMGTVEYPIPMGVDPHAYDTVVIWCRQFKVEIGRAYLPKKMM